MRKTIFLAVIACILGIVILAGLAFLIPGRLGNTGGSNESELFTGFEISDDSSKPVDSSISGSDVSSAAADSSETGKAASDASDADAPVAGTSEKDGSDTDDPDSPEEKNTGADNTDAGSGSSSKTGSSESGAGSRPSSQSHLTDSALIMDETEETENYASSVSSQRQSPQETSSVVKEHQIIWVGDSRTLGLRDALHKKDRKDDDIFVGKVGEGVHWFQEEGIGELADAIEQNPDLPVVMNLGVNDPQLIDEYIVTYWDVIEAWPDTDFYILSVNPIDEEFLIEDGQVADAVFDDINNLNVARMNVKLKKEFASRYIDSASYLKSGGFDTVDGLHFTADTYLRIHDFVVNKLF